MATSTHTEGLTSVFEQAIESLQQSAETNLRMQQEFLRRWTTQWPGFPALETPWVEKLRKFQKEWSNTVTELMRQHKELLDRQYRAGVESLDKAFQVAEAKDPEQLRQRSEALCRKSLECMRETAEAGMREYQEAMNRWLELAMGVATR